MKKNRLIFYAIFLLFHIGAFIFTIVLGNDSGFMMRMVSWVPYFKWITLAGVVLVIIDFIWAWGTAKNRDRERGALTHEVNTLKAKMFDLQEEMGKKTTAPAAEKPTPPSASGTEKVDS